MFFALTKLCLLWVKKYDYEKDLTIRFMYNPFKLKRRQGMRLATKKLFLSIAPMGQLASEAE